MIIHMELNGNPKCGARSYWSHSLSLATTSDGSTVTCKRCRGEVNVAETLPITENYVGKVFQYSYGYDMTINVYAKCIRQTAKTLILQECFCKVVDDDGRGSGKSWAGEVDPEKKPFSIVHKRKNTGHGNSYLYWAGGGSRHHWDLWNGQPDYYNTWD